MSKFTPEFVAAAGKWTSPKQWDAAFFERICLGYHAPLVSSEVDLRKRAAAEHGSWTQDGQLPDYMIKYCHFHNRRTVHARLA